MPGRLTNTQVTTLSDLSNITNMNEILDNICVVRIVGTPGHTRVRKVRKKQEISKFLTLLISFRKYSEIIILKILIRNVQKVNKVEIK